MNKTQQTIHSALPYFAAYTLKEIRAALPNIPDGTLRRNLTEMRKAGKAINVGGAWKQGL